MRLLLDTHVWIWRLLAPERLLLFAWDPSRTTEPERAVVADRGIATIEHTAVATLKDAVYGLPEYFSDSIRTARLVANPGCYATAAILPLAPLYKANAIDPGSVIVVDGKSGVSGAGRAPKQHTHFS